MGIFTNGATDHGNDALRSRRAGSTSSTLLPLSYTTPTSKQQQYRKSSPGYQYDDHMPPTPTCHNFLLGGNYFPGKDKRRKHMRKKKRNWWLERLAPVRLGVVTVVILYLLRYWFFSGTSRLHQASRRPFGWWWTAPNTDLNLGSRAQAQATAQRLQEQVNTVMASNQHVRHATLERLSPQWFHRNDNPRENEDTTSKAKTTDESKNTDPDASTSIVDKLKHKIKTSVKEKRDGDKQNSASHNTQQNEEPLAKHQDKDQIDKEASHRKNKESKPMLKNPFLDDTPPTTFKRTLKTMASFANRTACPSNLDDSAIVTTLVVQSSFDRSWVLGETCRRWTDPMVAVITLTQEESENIDISGVLEEWRRKCPQMNVVIHEMEVAQENPSMYPVNHLRNLGLDQVETSHLLVADVDFVPSNGLADEIRRSISLRQEIREKTQDAVEPANREAIVVPAFERNTKEPCLSETECKRFLQEDSSFIPHDFDALRDCVRNNTCTVFQSKDNWEGHYSTRSEKWLSRDWYEGEESVPDTNLKDLKRISCFDSFRYEPYVVIRWCPSDQASPLVSAPFYDERFHGYGKNKIEYIQHLRFMGYRFSVLPKGFIVHNPHPPSKAKEVWNDRDKHALHKDMDMLYPKFLTELFEQYKDRVNKPIGQCG